MTRIAALDTSTWVGGIALLEAGASAEPPSLVAELQVQVRDSHASRILGWLEILLGEAGWSRSELDLFVATRGPGSFTGVRIALGTIQGLALAADRPCVGVDTLEAIAEAHGPAELDRLPMMNAGRGEVYWARYDAGSTPPLVKRPVALGTVEGAVGADPEGAVLICGPGAEQLVRDVRVRAGSRSVGCTCGVAAAAGRLAAGREPEPGPLSPLYVRLPDAELNKRR